MKNYRKYLIAGLASIAFFLIGFLIISYLEKNNKEVINDDVMTLTKLAAISIDADKLGELKTTPEDNASVEYKNLRAHLSDTYMLMKSHGMTGIYTMSLRDGDIFFSVDSWAINERLHSEPGDPYKLPPRELFQVFRTGESLIAGPYTDEFGNWLSAFVPIKDSTDGRIIQVIGADIDGAYYAQKIWDYRIYSYLILFLYYTIALLLYFYITDIKNDIRNLEEEAKLLNDLMSSTPLCVKGFDSQGKLIFINKHGREEHHLTGLSEEEIKKWDFLTCIKEEYRPQIKEALESALKGKGTQDVIIEHVPGTSTGTWCSGDFIPVMNIDGSIKYVYFMSKDIDSIKLQHIELIAKTKELEKMNSLMVGRELKMIELKEELDKLKK